MPVAKKFCEVEVLEKALALFWARGFHATSMQDLVAGLGISRSSLYDTYGDKKQLFDRAFAHYCDKGLQSLHTLLERKKPVRDTLRGFLENQISASCADPERKGCFTINAANEMATDETTQNLLAKHRKRAQKVFKQLLEKGINSGEFSKNLDSKSTAALLFALYSGLQTMSKMSMSKKEVNAAVAAGLKVLDKA